MWWAQCNPGKSGATLRDLTPDKSPPLIVPPPRPSLYSRRIEKNARMLANRRGRNPPDNQRGFSTTGPDSVIWHGADEFLPLALGALVARSNV